MQQLMVRHAEIIRLSLLGLEQKEIAEKLGVRRNMVRKVLEQPLVRRELEIRREEILKNTEKNVSKSKEEARRLLDEASMQAAKTQINLLHDEDSGVALRASQAILDRALGKADLKTPISNQVLISIDQVQNLQLALRESGV